MERIGPHFIGLDISAFSGDLEIRLVHTMHRYPIVTLLGLAAYAMKR